jgi:hypothetical protein
MKQVTQFKNSRMVIMTAVLFLLAARGFSQETPFARLQRMVATTARDTLRKMLPSTTISPSSRLWTANEKPAIPFRPITAADYPGLNVKPDDMLTLGDGNKMRADQYFARLSAIEKEANKHGASLRDKEEFKSKTVTPASTLDGKAASTPLPVSKLKSEDELRKFLDPAIQSNGTTILPLGEDSKVVRKKQMDQPISSLDTKSFKIETVKLSPLLLSQTNLVSPLKTINETSSKDFSFGDPATFQAGVELSLTRVAKIFGVGTGKTELTITGMGRAYASILGHSFTAVKANGEFYVPADSAKKMTAKIVVNVGGMDVLNVNESYPSVKIISGSKIKPFESSKSVSFPLIWGFTLDVKVGIKGSVGLYYNAKLDRGYMHAEMTPVAYINGFLEFSLSAPLDIASVGVKSDLSFINGYTDLDAWFGIYTNNQLQLMFGYGYNVSYYLNFLKGDLKVTWKIGCINFLGEHCLARGEHEFFSWDGITLSGTLAEGRYLYNLGSTLLAHIDPIIR